MDTCKALMGRLMFPRSRGIWSVFIIWAPIVLWMAVIYFFSSQSSLPSIQAPLLEVLSKKTAHILEYAILAILWWRGLVAGGACQDRKKAAFYAVAISMLYALSDEFHQSFTPNRTPAFTDVLIDTFGASVGVFAVLFWARKHDNVPK